MSSLSVSAVWACAVGPPATPLHLWHESRAVLDRANWWLLHEAEPSDRVEAVERLHELASQVAVRS